jgi:uncharacterized protein
MSIAVAAVRVYRRHLSPRKGFRCAYGAAYGLGSCSDVGLVLASRVSLLRWLALMSLQSQRCRAAYLTLQSSDLEREWADRERRDNKEAERQALRCLGKEVVSCCPWP